MNRQIANGKYEGDADQHLGGLASRNQLILHLGLGD